MKVKAIAIKKPSGKVVQAKPPAHHVDLKTEGKRGFVLSDGSFANRTEAAKVAKKAGQAKPASKFLHSSDLDKRK